jgi:hypothetical protein
LALTGAAFLAGVLVAVLAVVFDLEGAFFVAGGVAEEAV